MPRPDLPKRYSFEPVAAMLLDGTPGPSAERANVSTYATALGVSTRAVQRWRIDGLNWRQADEIACRLGYHPVNLWPEWGDDAYFDAMISLVSEPAA